jgi:hypothetical protein
VREARTGSPQLHERAVRARVGRQRIDVVAHARGLVLQPEHRGVAGRHAPAALVFQALVDSTVLAEGRNRADGAGELIALDMRDLVREPVLERSGFSPMFRPAWPRAGACRRSRRHR